MARLPRSPDLNWRDDGTPVAVAHDDVYFSAHDGLTETRTVYLAGCGLPGAWANRKRFTVAETGFGTGLNFLALWQMWREHRPADDAWLHFVSFEGFPLRREDAARALAAWPELAGLAAKLLGRWPHGAKGVRRIIWPEEGVSFTLHIGDIEATLPESGFQADAWFLDGFSPAKNTAMWGGWIYPEIAARSGAGARVGTFTVAGHVRRGLADAGFEVSKAPGHGRKRDRLEAVFTGAVSQRPDVSGVFPTAVNGPRIAVIGGGIAGASTAHALCAAGKDVTLFERADRLAGGASGNPLALVMPRLDAGDTVQARLLIDAYLTARAVYAGLPGVTETSVRHMPRDEKEAARFAKVLADPPLPLEDLEAIQGGGLLHKGALIIRPHLLIPALAQDADVQLGQAVEIDLAERRVNGEAYDAIVLANSMAIMDLTPWMGLAARLGQIEHVDHAPVAEPSACAAGHYALAEGRERLWGATFEAADGAPTASSEAQSANAEGLETLDPWWRAQVRDLTAVSRAGLRATTPDRLPLIGAVPDAANMREVYAGLRTGRSVTADTPLMAGVFVANGFGSRGFTWGPWAGGLLAAQIAGGPAAASHSALEAVSPARLIIRALKRGT